MNKAKKLIKNVKIIILLIFLVLAIVSIHPNPYASGVAIRSVDINSSAALSGITSPKATTTPMSRERVIAINNIPIMNMDDYYSQLVDLKPNKTMHIKTNKEIYKLTTKPLTETIVLNESINITVTEEILVNKTFTNNTNNETYVMEVLENKTTIKEVPKTITNIIGTEDIGLSVYDAPKSNIRKGLDLQGGTRVLLKPETALNKEDMSFLLDGMKERLNVYGLSDVIVREAGDLSGNQFILVEIAGAAESEVRELIAKQGKFEAKIANDTVFIGGRDVTYVCRSADCSGIDPNIGCSRSGESWFCRFRFSITLTPEAAKRQADLTRNLEIISENNDDYLSEKLILLLDDVNVDELNIGSELRGKATTEIQISGSGDGTTKDEAIFTALENMKRLQTILITGSLPVKLEIAKTDSISPVLGEEFTKNAIVVGLLAILTVAIVIFIRYRRLKIALPLSTTIISEVIILLGVASLIGWNLDLAAIAGIIIAVGTGVDHQIVITDETLRGDGSTIYDWKKRIKKAFFIIMATYFTTLVAMIPLLFAGAGMLKGFALTTIIGVSIGVFITRPAFAAAIEILIKD